MQNTFKFITLGQYNTIQCLHVSGILKRIAYEVLWSISALFNVSWAAIKSSRRVETHTPPHPQMLCKYFKVKLNATSN